MNIWEINHTRPHRNNLPVSYDNVPMQQIEISVGKAYIIVPYSIIEYGGRFVIQQPRLPEIGNATKMGSNINKISNKKSKEKIDICSTHIYTQR